MKIRDFTTDCFEKVVEMPGVEPGSENKTIKPSTFLVYL